MQVDKEALGEVLARLKAGRDGRTTRTENQPHVNAELLRELQPIRPHLITELARRMDKSRWGIYYMLRDDYGQKPKSREEIAKLNELLKEIRKEVEEQVKKAADK